MTRNQQLVSEVAAQILAQGYRVFIAKRGDYGFFTDAEGSRVISFGCDLGGINFSGNYKTSIPQQTGTGWRITDNLYDAFDCAQIFNASAPWWAVGDATWNYTTLAQYLKTYQPSSEFSELNNEAAA